MRTKAFNIFILIFFTCVYSSCSKPKDLVYQEVKNFRVNQLGFKETTIGLDMVYYNPNKYSLECKGGDVDVFMNDKYLGKANIESRTVIPKQDTFSVPVSLTMDMQSMLQNSLELLAKPDVTIKLKGYVKVGKKGIYFNVPVDYITQQRIEIK
jgi:LEA14-like dessication related protein